MTEHNYVTLKMYSFLTQPRLLKVFYFKSFKSLIFYFSKIHCIMMKLSIIRTYENEKKKKGREVNHDIYSISHLYAIVINL